jgi:hypothetical protein
VQLFSDNYGDETGDSFDINYLVGSVSGPIIVSNVTFASTSIAAQAFAAADQVNNEDLGMSGISGIIGLALPANSIIQNELTSNIVNPNNTEVNSNQTGSILPGLWEGLPASSRIFGMGLQRLPSDGGNGNSTITFAGPDYNYVSTDDQQYIKYAPVVPDDDNIKRKWKLFVSDFRVASNGTTFQIPLTTTGVSLPTAILDSGSPLNLASVSFLNAMYGAIDVGPAADGSGGYYVDCTLPLQLSINLGNGLIPIHPLDSNLRQDSAGTGSGGNSGCIGSFQALSNDDSGDDLDGAQIILGAPFLRSVYSIYNCNDGSTTNTNSSDCSNPQVGLFPLYNTSASSAQALTDFNKVRVLGQSLGDNSIVGKTSGSSSSTSKGSSFGTGAKIAVGVVGGLLGLLLLMALLLVLLKRRRGRMLAADRLAGVGSYDMDKTDPVELSEKEKQRKRELALLHGQFVEDLDEPGESMTTGPARTLGADSHTDWDISSKGYWEARAIKNEYQKRKAQRASRQSSPTLSPTVHDPDAIGEETHELIPLDATNEESHELVDLSPHSPKPPSKD